VIAGARDPMVQPANAYLLGANQLMPMIDVYANAGTFPDKHSLAERTWVLLTESPEAGWGIGGHANTAADIATAARDELAADR